MSTKSRKITKKDEVETQGTNVQELSAKELYDIKKEQRQKEKQKKDKKSKKKKKKFKTYETNLAGRIFAFIMLLLMIASVVGYVVSYFQ